MGPITAYPLMQPPNGLQMPQMLAAAPQQVQAPTQIQPPPVLGAQGDPQSQMLAQILQSMGQEKQGNTSGLLSNLAADALLRKAYANNQMQAQQQAAGISPADIAWNNAQNSGANDQFLGSGSQ